MAIEISLDPTARRWLSVFGVLLALVTVLGIGWLGQVVTPNPARLLTWDDWQALKIERQYRAELAALRTDVGELAAALRVAPDPIRIGLLHDRLAQRHQTGLPLLAQHRAALLAANDAVYAWALTELAQTDAEFSVQEAVNVLGPDDRQP